MAGVTRKSVINELPLTNPALARLWDSHKRSIEGFSKFSRTGGRFPLTAVGKINTYSIFAETARSICSSDGRVGMIVPSGIATDDTTKVFFADLVNRQSLVSLYDFENREGVFPGVHRSYKFCLLTLTGAGSPSSQAEFAFFLHRTEQLHDTGRRFALAAADFALFNPNTRTCPVFRTRRDADIGAKLYRRAGVFWKEARGGEPEANPWGVHFSQMFNMTSDSGLFRTREQLQSEGWQLEGNVFFRGDERYLPLYEAKLFHQYDHRFATFDDVDERALSAGNARNMAVDEKIAADSVVIPRYWVPEAEVSHRLVRSADVDHTPPPRSDVLHTRRTGPQLALRNIVRATDERTGILSMIGSVGLSHSGTTISVGSSLSGT